MWANQHPAPRAFRPLRGPVANVVARATRHNRAELAEQAASGQLHSIEAPAMFAIQVVPFARMIAAARPGHAAHAVLPVRWRRVWQGAVHEESGGGSRAAPAAQSEAAPAIEPADEIED